MIMHRHGESLLRVFLADAMQIKLGFDLGRLEDRELRLLLLLGQMQFAVEDVFAKDDAVVADINSRPGDELLHFGMRFTAEAAHRDVGGTGHVEFMILDL